MAEGARAYRIEVLAGGDPLREERLTRSLREWCGRERHRKVRIVRGDTELEITGNPSAKQQRLAREFMEKFEDDA